jgi:hypothetical protein
MHSVEKVCAGPIRYMSRCSECILSGYLKGTKTKQNSMALARERTIPTERPPLVSQVSANFLRIDGAMWSA